MQVTAAPTLMRRGLRLMSRFVRMHPGSFAVAVTGAFVFSTMAVASTVVLGRVTDEILLPAFDGGVETKTIWVGAVVIVGVAFFRGAGVVARRYWGQMTTRRVQASLRSQLADHYTRVPVEFFRRHPTGELLAHSDTDVEVATEVMNPLPFSIGVFVLLAFSVVSLLFVDVVLAIVGFVLFPALAALNRFYTRRVERPAAAVQQYIGEVSSIAHESFDGALVVKALGRESYEVERLAQASDRLREQRLEVGRLRALFEPTLDALPNLGIIAVLLVGGYRVDAGAVTPGDLVQVMSLFTLLIFPMRVLGYLLEELPRSVVALVRVDRVLGDVGGTSGASGEADAPAGALGIEVDRVAFAYETGQPVLSDCTFGVAPGETVALVGATGAGKSTLCEMIAGLVPPDSGAVRVGGRSLADLSADAARGAVALVFQESFLFADTVAENIRLGTQADDDAIRRAASVAAADTFIRALPDGYSTVVGERGVTLSGGQRQRIALARALVRSPRILLLDDATSAVDPTVESRIIGALARELAITTLIVAHRLSTIELADRVLFLLDGRIRATGAHRDLLGIAEYEAMVRAYEEVAT